MCHEGNPDIFFFFFFIYFLILLPKQEDWCHKRPKISGNKHFWGSAIQGRGKDNWQQKVADGITGPVTTEDQAPQQQVQEKETNAKGKGDDISYDEENVGKYVPSYLTEDNANCYSFFNEKIY